MVQLFLDIVPIIEWMLMFSNNRNYKYMPNQRGYFNGLRLYQDQYKQPVENQWHEIKQFCKNKNTSLD